jgi:glycosyltransferase involved in cell wall biosynthesis
VIGYGVPPGKVQRIHNAYHGPRAEDVRETRAEARAQLGLAPDRRYVLTICRLMVWKRVDGILAALVGLPDDVHLLVAGDGDMEPVWKALAVDLGLGERVLWLGNVPHARIPLLIRAADVFVLNSRYEGLSHTLLEVQALGTPIVASNVCGNPEVVEHGKNGLLVDPLDANALREALRWILGDPEMGKRFVEAGFARRDDFRRDLTFGDVEAQLARLAGGNESGPGRGLGVDSGTSAAQPAPAPRHTAGASTGETSP